MGVKQRQRREVTQSGPTGFAANDEGGKMFSSVNTRTGNARSSEPQAATRQCHPMANRTDENCGYNHHQGECVVTKRVCRVSSACLAVLSTAGDKLVWGASGVQPSSEMPLDA